MSTNLAVSLAHNAFVMHICHNVCKVLGCNKSYIIVCNPKIILV